MSNQRNQPEEERRDAAEVARDTARELNEKVPGFDRPDGVGDRGGLAERLRGDRLDDALRNKEREGAGKEEFQQLAEKRFAEKADDFKESASDKLETIKEKAEDAKETAKDWAGKASDKASEIKDSVKEKWEKRDEPTEPERTGKVGKIESKEDVINTLSSPKRVTKEEKAEIRDAAEVAKATQEDLSGEKGIGGKMEEMKESAKEKMEDMKETAEEKGSDWADAAKEKVKEGWNSTKETVAEKATELKDAVVEKTGGVIDRAGTAVRKEIERSNRKVPEAYGDPFLGNLEMPLESTSTPTSKKK